MYLTRMQLDMSKRKTMTAMTAPKLFHGAVERSFPGERKRRLWRIDRLKDKWYLLILSEDQPNLTSAVDQFGMDNEGWETKSYDKLLRKVDEGQEWHFKLTANPTKCLQTKDGKDLNVSLYEDDELLQWLVRQGDKKGFSVKKENIMIENKRWTDFCKGYNRKDEQIRFEQVTYEGILSVTDRELFKNTLCSGIGREKAYGMGMLTIAGQTAA